MASERLAHDPFDALGDEHRRAIVESLAEEEMSVAEIAGGIPISRPAVSRHLKLLKEAGLVVDRAEGTRRVYSLHSEGIEAMTEFMASIWGDATTRFRLAAENTKERER